MTEAEKIAAAIARRAAGIAAAGSKAAWIAELLAATVERVVDDDTGTTVDVEVSSDAPEVAGGVVKAISPQVVVSVRGRFVCPVAKASGSAVVVGLPVLAVRLGAAVVVFPVEVL
jgi:hypothetical protein